MTSYFNWTEAKKYEFACVVQKEKGHMKTDKSFKVKWTAILKSLKDKPSFSDLSIKYNALQNTFERFKEAVLKDCGISEEGANLSGLPEETPEYIKLMVCLAEQAYKQEQSSKTASTKKRTIQKGLLTHEAKELSNQGRSFNLDDPITASGGSKSSGSGDQLLNTSPLSSDSNDDKSSTVLRQVQRSKTFLEKFSESLAEMTKDDAVTLELENQEKAMELRHKEQEFQDRQEEKRRRLEMDARSLALQERQLALMEALLIQRQQN